MFTLAQLESAAELVHAHVSPTPAHAWPLLRARTGCELFVKHENHTPIGAFKVRGGLTYLDGLVRSGRKFAGLITATRGNHGQSIPFAARIHGIPVTVVAPKGNSREKNAAMQALGTRLIEHGRDFEEAKQEAERLSKEEGLEFVPSFHENLVRGVATYGLELFRAVPDLDTVLVPIGMGSGICGTIAARNALGLRTKVVGVVAAGAPAVALSFRERALVPTNASRTFADGIACRVPNAESMTIIWKGAERVVEVSEDDIAAAIRAIFQDTHNVAEGAGAAPLAALLKERASLAGRKVAVILSGGNIDLPAYQEVLAGRTPQPF